MPAYVIAEHIITDAAKFEEYRTKAGPMIAKLRPQAERNRGSHNVGSEHRE